jgi:hypothetical protein
MLLLHECGVSGSCQRYRNTDQGCGEHSPLRACKWSTVQIHKLAIDVRSFVHSGQSSEVGRIYVKLMNAECCEPCLITSPGNVRAYQPESTSVASSVGVASLLSSPKSSARMCRNLSIFSSNERRLLMKKFYPPVRPP